MTGSRYFSGSRAISSCRAGSRSSGTLVPDVADAAVICSGLPFAGAAPGRGDVRLDRDAVRHAVQPAAQGLAPPDRAGLLDQDEEGRLEGVLGVVGVAEDAAADREHHRPVPRHQGLERRRIGLGEEAVEELGVGQPGDRPAAEQVADLPQRGAQGLDGHGS